MDASKSASIVAHRYKGLEGDCEILPMRTAINSLQRKFGDDVENHTYNFHPISSRLRDA